MAAATTISLAKLTDATGIAMLSRELVEGGLPWRWTPPRVINQIRSADSTVIVARAGKRLAGFAIMEFGFEFAHLSLLAVSAEFSRRGIGRELVIWLEESAWTAGISAIRLEVRLSNLAAQQFYRSLDYEEVETLPKYYCGREPGLRMLHILRLPEQSPTELQWPV